MHAEGRSERFQRYQGKTKDGVEKDVTIVTSMRQHSLSYSQVGIRGMSAHPMTKL